VNAERAGWGRQEFEAQLRAKEARYHVHHPFQVALNSGGVNQRQIRGWVANRFYYQVSIPLKDAALLSNCGDRAVRREWLRRITDHDGVGDEPGGIEAWLRLGEAVGLTRDALLSHAHVLPGVRFAVDAYVNFARVRPWQETVTASLTELFAPSIHQARLKSWPEHYPWIDPEGYAYFRQRLSQARRDVQFALDFTLDHYRSRAEQERALAILDFKLDVLWCMLDAMAVNYGIGDERFFGAAGASA
jgi:pyrroloquinoline-quinone synthase